MLKDIKVSTILLLAVVGVLIYCLTKPSTISERFANAETESVSEAKHRKNTPHTEHRQNTPHVEHSQNTPHAENRQNNQLPDRMTRQPEISSELVNQILDESEMTIGAPSMGFGASMGKEESIGNASSRGRGALMNVDASTVDETLMGVGEPNVEGGTLHNYHGIDNEIADGALLDSAFNKPIPDNTKTDVVNLNKNNVKNYDAKDYLPKEINDDWFNTDFSQAKYKMNDDKLINTERYVIGINTVGQSLKNASYDIRGAVNVSKYSVSPWNQSTIEPDYNIKPLC